MKMTKEEYELVQLSYYTQKELRDQKVAKKMGLTFRQLIEKLKSLEGKKRAHIILRQERDDRKTEEETSLQQRLYQYKRELHDATLRKLWQDANFAGEYLVIREGIFSIAKTEQVEWPRNYRAGNWPSRRWIEYIFSAPHRGYGVAVDSKNKIISWRGLSYRRVGRGGLEFSCDFSVGGWTENEAWELLEGRQNTNEKSLMIASFFSTFGDTTGRLKEIQRDDYGVLFRVTNSIIPLLQLKNSTPELDGTYRYYYLAVRSGISSAHAAVADSFSCSTEEYVLTAQS